MNAIGSTWWLCTKTTLSTFDAQIAGIARSRGAALATRNVRDFAGCGIELHDPWVPARR
jgi:predicted nucleic acid-binding protein